MPAISGNPIVPFAQGLNENLVRALRGGPARLAKMVGLMPDPAEAALSAAQNSQQDDAQAALGFAQPAASPLLRSLQQAGLR